MAASNPTCRAITDLFEQGIIQGYFSGDCAKRGFIGPCFGPDDLVQRAQVAAMIVRAFAWQNEPVAATPFDDLDGLAPGLAQAILILNEKGIFQGYDSDSAGPNDRLSVAQAISIVARSFVIAGYWEEQPGTSVPYTGVPAIHAADIATAHHYLGTIPNAPVDADSWNAPTSRAWVAWLLALALETATSR
ncbi:MAG: S-layer homology domain-containing protein [Thermomicrobiales bacterium]